MKKKLLSIVLSLAMLVAFMPTMTFTSFAAEGNEYSKASSFTLGNKYIITTAESGEAYALANGTNGSAKFDTVGVNITGGKITETSGLSKAVWEAKPTKDGSNLIGLYNGSNVLKIDASGDPYINTSATSYNAGGFGYTTNNHISYPYTKSGERTSKDYFIGSDNSAKFKASNTETDLDKVYIFEYSGGGTEPDPGTTGGDEDPVTSGDVEVTPVSSDSPVVNKEVAVNGTFNIIIKNGSEYNQKYTFTIGVDKNGIVSLSESSVEIAAGETGTVKVTGLKDGDVTLTINNGNNRKATVNVKVGAGGSDEPVTPPVSGDDVELTPQQQNSNPPSVSKTINVGSKFNAVITNGSSSSGYTFTATVGNKDVASISPESKEIAAGKKDTFEITGRKAGTTTITFSNNSTYGAQYSRTAVINLTVVGSGDPGDPEEPEEPATNLETAKANAVKALNDLAGTEPPTAISNILNAYIPLIEGATSIDTVNEYRNRAEGLIQAELNKEVEKAKTDAIAEITKLAENDKTEAMQKVLADETGKINAATTLDGVKAALEAAKTAVSNQLKADELAVAKEEAIKEMTALVVGEQSEAMKKVIEEQTALINKAETLDAVALALTAAKEAVNKQIEADKLQAAKDEAIAELEKAAGRYPSDEMKALLESLKDLINEVASITDLEKAVTEAAEAIKEQKEKEEQDVELEAAKEEAFDMLDRTVETVELKYRDAEQGKVCKVVNNYDKKIKNAVSVKEVNSLVKEFKAEIAVFPLRQDYDDTAEIAVKIKSVTVGSKMAAVKWTPKKTFAGYRIAYKESGKSWKYKTVKGASKSSLLIKSLKKGKKYSFKVRGYKLFGETKVYGKYSKAISKKIK